MICCPEPFHGVLSVVYGLEPYDPKDGLKLALATLSRLPGMPFWPDFCQYRDPSVLQDQVGLLAPNMDGHAHLPQDFNNGVLIAVLAVEVAAGQLRGQLSERLAICPAIRTFPIVSIEPPHAQSGQLVAARILEPVIVVQKLAHDEGLIKRLAVFFCHCVSSWVRVRPFVQSRAFVPWITFLLALCRPLCR